MARAAYQKYLEWTKVGLDARWELEARVRLEELEKPGGVVVESRAKLSEKRCPFCKDTIAKDAVSAECAECGTPHHLSCYEEQGGCTIYGCGSNTAKAKVAE